MSIHNIRKAASLLNDEGLIKKANINKDFSTDSKDETLATAVEVAYLIKVAHEHVPYHVQERVTKAVNLYGLTQDVTAYMGSMISNNAMEKVASANEQELRAAEVIFEGNLAGLVDLEKIASQAEQLDDNYGEMIKSAEVKRYAGEFVLNKVAAVEHLKARHYLTKNEEFVKIASIIEASKPDTFTSDDNRLIARAVTMLDKQAKLNVKGFNFYKEAFITKQAAVSALPVTINGKTIAIETLLSKSAQLEQIVGEKMPTDPQTLKAVVESLPLDLQKMICHYV